MPKALELCGDFDAEALRRLARASRDAGQSRRLLALVLICEGGSRTQSARTGAVGLQTVRPPAASRRWWRPPWPGRACPWSS